MRSKRKNLAVVLLLLLLACLLPAFLMLKRGRADAEKLISDHGDEIKLTDVSYGSGGGFVYSARVEFRSGDAAGLVFGGKDNHAWSFLVDRIANRVKLLYFTDGTPKELASEFYVGPSNMNEDQQNFIREKTRTLGAVSLKIVLSPEYDGTYLELYADGIQRFVFTDASLPTPRVKIEKYDAAYAGGALGYHCCNADVEFTEISISETDLSNYAEMYRNQYHYSQFAHWNNDPNGLVYYKGYYHLYYQHNPFSLTWGDMYWGHARSTDLVHWENLPIAMVPDFARDGLGYMWSGTLRVYHKGEGALDDWIGGKDDGLVGFYTRDGAGGNKYTVSMSSTDGGLTFVNHEYIERGISAGASGSWRDPKVFNLAEYGIPDAGEFRWGMALSDMDGQRIFFLVSKDMIGWQDAGNVVIECDPECPDLMRLAAEGESAHTVITMTSRYYVVCDLGYLDGRIVLKDVDDGSVMDRIGRTDLRLKKMEFASDSYANASYFIDDTTSVYYGKTVGLHWFAAGGKAEPNTVSAGACASARKIWNGGGFTTPVEYGLKKAGGDYLLTQTPVGKADVTHGLTKTAIDGFDKVDTHQLEISAKISNPAREPVVFRVNVSADGSHYTEIGWNKKDGYYVDRTHTEQAGVPFLEHVLRYNSRMGKRDTALDFYILVDDGGVEAFCGGATVPFYLITFASPYSTGTSFTKSASATVEELTLNKIGTVWREEREEDGKYIALSESLFELDTLITREGKLIAYAGGSPIHYTVVEGGSVVAVRGDADGATISALGAGRAIVEVRAGNSTRNVEVNVTSGKAESDLCLVQSGILAGKWHLVEDGINGENFSGDGYLLSQETGKDFFYSANFDLGGGTAAALLFRASEKEGRLASYYCANFDRNGGGRVKLWTENGLLGDVETGVPANTANITLTVKAQGNRIEVYLNGKRVIKAEAKEADATEGRFGVNVFNTSAVFHTLLKSDFEVGYDGEGDCTITMIAPKENLIVRNKELGYRKVEAEYLKIEGRTVTIDADYFKKLEGYDACTFVLEDEDSAFTVRVTLAEGKKRDRTGLIVGLTVGLGVPLLAAAGVTAWLLLRGKHGKKTSDSDGENE